jgi:hypothetical protein
MGEEVRQKAGFDFSEGAMLVSVAGGQSVRGGAPLDLVVAKVGGIQNLFFKNRGIPSKASPPKAWPRTC